MKIVTMGLGYIGLPTSLMFANHGVEVVGVDVSEETVDQLNQGIVPIEEPGVQDFLQTALEIKQFQASLVPDYADAFIIAVPTPNIEDQYGSCDLQYVKRALQSILPYVRFGNTIVIESTIAPRTMDDVVAPFFEEAGFEIGSNLFLVHCPERVLPGKILHELIFNDRIIGGITPACTKKGQILYQTFVQGELLGTEAKTAELSKLMENTYRDVNIALANELVQIGTKLKINALEVIRLANRHPRVNIHQPGPGVGGHCLAVDPYFIVAAAPKEAELIYKSRQINSSMPQFILNQVVRMMEMNKGTKLTILGQAYKGNIDDIRESPAVQITKQLKLLTDYQIAVYDPHVQKENADTLKQAFEGSDLALILCDHDEFKKISIENIQLMKTRIAFDTKNILSNRTDFDKYYTLGNIFQFEPTNKREMRLPF
ncbi:nucleotide sugar dehydrogenase [Listeria kieliensis]|uniref:UDP-N-acetyl-D-mannosamine dehydrogenase n=1 Tax=Listeria kieliensis TaxID=1621700 RepID=A0A3D8TTT7_9LIST|nr:nucleotide sugar dehydrogenase [Listeria kieliensis]RDX02252.1 UDP-N-acetyl-D-mannosamine dehydrogenase [Listeria kieliensis]